MSDLDILKKNRGLKNLHAGKRCFLIGNGPSIAAQNLLLLKNEVKICFNSFHKHPQCKEIGPDYWLTADPEIWNKKEQFLMPLLEAVESSEIVTKLFFPLWGAIKVSGNRFLDIHYFTYDHSNRDMKNDIDFCAGIPPFAQNVMIVGLMFAFYLGCNPIIMVGADHTWWNWEREDYSGKETPHFFKNDYSPISERYSFDILQSTITVQRHQYLQLLKYAALRGFEIFNATPESALDLFTRIDYDTLFLNEDSQPSAHEYLSFLPSPAMQLGATAQNLIKDRHFAPALVLVDEALRQNINRSSKIAGLNYLRSICLAGLGHTRDAIMAARQDFICNPANRHNSSRLLRAMGDALPNCTN